MKAITDFAGRFNAAIRLDETSLMTKEGRYFLVNKRLKPFARNDFFYVGSYLGKFKKGVFFPSFILLGMLAEGRANKIVLDDKSAWLFIVGRDVFKRGIVKVSGAGRKGDYVLTMNRHRECLGFGRVMRNLDQVKGENEVVVKNISDIGDFLRRER